MASNNTVVIFTKFNARIEKDVSDEEAAKLRGYPNVAVNPDLKRVLHEKPHYWRLGRSKNIYKMTKLEKDERDRGILAYEKEHGPIPNTRRHDLLLKPYAHQSVLPRPRHRVLLTKALNRSFWVGLGIAGLYAWIQHL